MVKKVLALLAVLALLLAFASCKKADPQEETTVETTTAEDLAVVVTEPDTTQTEEDTSEPEDTTTDDAASTTEAQEVSTEEGATTTKAEPTTKAPAAKPSTKAEIVTYVNGVMTNVRTAKPGYTMQEITHIDGDGITSSNGAVKTLAKGVVSLSKSLWSKWTDPSVKEKGADHNGVNPKTDLQESWVKSASCSESGNNYVIRVNIIDERVTKLPENEKDTMHGKIMMAQTRGGIEDGAAQLGLKFSKAELFYSGSYIELTVNKATGLPTKITAYTNYKMDMVVDLFGGLDAVIPLANEKLFTF